VVRRVEVDAVVAPAALARELRDRHQLDVGDAQVDQVVEPSIAASKVPSRREGADVELVDHGRRQRRRPPAAVAPR
jgi:hypothetical protein